MDALALLKQFNTSHEPAEEEDEDVIQRRAMEIVAAKENKPVTHSHGNSSGAGFDAIPKFFFGKKRSAPPPVPQEGVGALQSTDTSPTFRRLFDDLVFSRALNSLEEQVLGVEAEATISHACTTLAHLAAQSAADAEDDSGGALDYDQFCTLGSHIVEDENFFALDQYFKATVFLQLADPTDHLIGLGDLQSYMVQHQRYLHALLLLSRIVAQRSGDVVGTAQLTEVAFESFVATFLKQEHHSGPRPFEIEAELVSFYRLMVVRRFFFFLDPNRRGVVGMKALLRSPELEAFLESQYPQDFHYMLEDEDHGETAREAQREFEAQNAFAPSNLLAVYEVFAEVDKDGNGMISEEEMAGFDKQMLTPRFLKHLFQETFTFRSKSLPAPAMEMDFRGFLDFCLAAQRPSELASLKYYWRSLDFEKRGFLSRRAVEYFMHDILEICADIGVETAPLPVVVDNMWDLAQPAAQDRITLQDLINCKQGGVFVSALSSTLQFIKYDQRET